MKNCYTAKGSSTEHHFFFVFVFVFVFVSVTSESSKGPIDELETFRNCACFFSTSAYSKKSDLERFKEKQKSQ